MTTASKKSLPNQKEPPHTTARLVSHIGGKHYSYHCSQIDVVIKMRDDLLRQKRELEEEMEEQSQDQNDIYQYLRKKLKDNYIAIAALESKAREIRPSR